MENPLQPAWKTASFEWNPTTAAHLLNRAGFGGSSDEVQALVDLGPEQAMIKLVNLSASSDDLPPMQFGELSGPPKEKPRELLKEFAMLKPDERKAYAELRRVAAIGKMDELKLWWLDRMVRTTRPLEEKMTLFFHGLFVSSNATVKNTYHLYKQNQLFRQYAVGNVEKLTVAVSKDPAMLEYLNNNQNVKEHPNENYARELMELFTLGLNDPITGTQNYTETDIKESARSFTGWTFLGETFYNNQREHDTGSKTFLGQTGNWDGADIVRIIFQRPAAARYFALRLVRFFGLDDPLSSETEALAKPMVAALADVLRANKYDLVPTLAAFFGSAWFYSPDVMRRQIKSPTQLVVGAMRQLRVALSQPGPVDNSLKLMGQELFNAFNVKGWDGGRAWISTSTLFARYNLPAYLVTGRLPTGGKQADPSKRTDFADFNSGWQPTLELAAANACTTDTVVDFYIRELINDAIPPEKRNELIQQLNATGDTKQHPFDPTANDSEARLRGLVHLLMMMPEYQIC
jgi:hypothetical protein